MTARLIANTDTADLHHYTIYHHVTLYCIFNILENPVVEQPAVSNPVADESVVHGYAVS